MMSSCMPSIGPIRCTFDSDNFYLPAYWCFNSALLCLGKSRQQLSYKRLMTAQSMQWLTPSRFYARYALHAADTPTSTAPPRPRYVASIRTSKTWYVMSYNHFNIAVCEPTGTSAWAADMKFSSDKFVVRAAWIVHVYVAADLRVF